MKSFWMSPIAWAVLFAVCTPALPAIAEPEEGVGIRVGERTLFRPAVSAELGAISNVFYSEAEPIFAGVLRVIGEFKVGSLAGQRMQRGPVLVEDDQDGLVASPGEESVPRFAYHVSARVAYQEYLSGNEDVRAQRDVRGSVSAQAVLNPRGTWALIGDNQFLRDVRPTNFESSQDVDRNINWFKLQLNFQPAGRNLHGSLRYENFLELFESAESSFANRMRNIGGLRVQYDWRPITRFYGDASFGLISGIGGQSTKTSSMPLRLESGVETALSVRTTLVAKAGYANGFYSSGAGYQSIFAGVEGGYRFSPHGRVTALYAYDFDDSINANYLRDHLFKLTAVQHVDRVTLDFSGDVRLRKYVQVIVSPFGVRDDILFRANIGATYRFSAGTSLYGTYWLSLDETDFRYTAGQMTDDPSFVRHELVVGARHAF